jgi:hypothetical protein
VTFVMLSPYNNANNVEIPSFEKKFHHLKMIHVWSDFFLQVVINGVKKKG